MPRLGSLLPTIALLSVFRTPGTCHGFAPSNRLVSRRTTRASTLSALLERKEDVVSTTTPTTTDLVETIPDDSADGPASMVFYDSLLGDLENGVVCARGVCVLEDFDFDESDEESSNSLVDAVLNSYLGPRALLAGASILYGTNFALGSIMNDALNPSAATCARMVLASLALGPFLLQLAPTLFVPALICGCFTATGYISQSVALTTVAPATVAFLGAATVLVCPTLEAVVNKKPMGLKDAPQVWLAAFLCLTGVAILELFDPSGGSVAFQQVGWGDFLSILQAVGFGTSFFLTERMMRGQPDQALPITAVQVSVTAFLCMIWCLGDGWIGTAGTESFGLPNMFLDPNLKIAAAAVAWTGLATTALNRFVETSALGKVSSAEASVILATEPLWAALFAALWLSDNAFGLNDYVGGALIVLACLANTLQPKDFKMLLGESTSSTTNTNS